MKVALCACVASSPCFPPNAAYGSPRVHLKGASRVDPRVGRERGRLVLTGVVFDDASRPVAGARVRMALLHEPDRAPVSLASAQACARAPGGPPPTLERAASLISATDEGGHFCVALALSPAGGMDRYAAHFEVLATTLLDGCSADLAVDLAAAPVTLRFDPEPTVWMLDGDTTELKAVASVEDDGVLAPAADLALSLTNERGAELGRATTDATGRARFSVESARLGAPGLGTLSVTFAGKGGMAAARRDLRVERHTRVTWNAPRAVANELPIGSPEDGIPLDLTATLGCARRGCAAFPGGTLEARVGPGDDIVGASAVERGAARITLVFATPALREVAVRVRYLPSAPWFEASDDLVLMQPVRPPSAWRKAPLVLAAACALAWVALLRLPAGWRNRGPKRTRPQRPRVHGEGIEVVPGTSPISGGPGGWRGRITDAHSGQAVRHARVSIERRGFERIEVRVEVIGDGDGAFSIQPSVTLPGDELAIAHALYATLRRALPPPGELVVALISRRRALLERLIAWARRRGPPFDALPDPSPGHIQRAAAADEGVARWAGAVERAVYGENAVDEHAEAGVRELEPDRPLALAKLASDSNGANTGAKGR